ncbi:Diaminopimelate epimerase-like protein [Lophiostoma macrostomum CBS 122681]|uniref:trans-L-3-hydroxyproline dehydratase n=1 Tax=Lophiostoma macrostomum CBS 122681 TaxID=1314788 RepID=A0A6A6ST35_9PLEO|nr:Diaminopimelate epimerase-like protein [Lophiostoma macrostomum CBS 122681]
MDVIKRVSQSGAYTIGVVETHTIGEPTRIVISGYPSLSGTLLEQRAQAKAQYDHIRRRLLLEPAGHADMYGAILRPVTELTTSGDAHIGVLFCHNEGYSTMCGHATIALGRFLIDTWDESVFPRRREIRVDEDKSAAEIRLHAPCGLVVITVPVVESGQSSDPTRPVSFVNLPAFATGRDVPVHIPQPARWPRLGGRETVTVDFCYGGAFTCLVSTEQLGFGKNGLKLPIDSQAMNAATKVLREVIQADESCQQYVTHPMHKELSSLYTLIVVDKDEGRPLEKSTGVETGLCYFAAQQIDRSPTGSAVTARVAHAYAIGRRHMGQPWTYHSLVSNSVGGQGGFVGTPVEEVSDLYDTKSMLGTPVRVKVEGYAYYVGSHTFVAEKEDPFVEGGFLFDALTYHGNDK